MKRSDVETLVRRYRFSPFTPSEYRYPETDKEFAIGLLLHNPAAIPVYDEEENLVGITGLHGDIGMRDLQ